MENLRIFEFNKARVQKAFKRLIEYKIRRTRIDKNKHQSRQK